LLYPSMQCWRRVGASAPPPPRLLCTVLCAYTHTCTLIGRRRGVGVSLIALSSCYTKWAGTHLDSSGILVTLLVTTSCLLACSLLPPLPALQYCSTYSSSSTFSTNSLLTTCSMFCGSACTVHGLLLAHYLLYALLLYLH
jgi:hypothetical protein